MIPTWSIEKIFDLEAEQRGRDASFTVRLSCYCLQPKHIIVQRLWETLSWVWGKEEHIKKEFKVESCGKIKKNKTKKNIKTNKGANRWLCHFNLTACLLWANILIKRCKCFTLIHSPLPNKRNQTSPLICLTQTLVIRSYTSQGHIKHRQLHPLLAVMATEQYRRLRQLEVQEGFQHLVPSPPSPRLPHDGNTQCLAGRGTAGSRQAFQGEQATPQQRGGWQGGVAVEDVIGSQASKRALGNWSGVWSWGGWGWGGLWQDVRLV